MGKFKINEMTGNKANSTNLNVNTQQEKDKGASTPEPQHESPQSTAFSIVKETDTANSGIMSTAQSVKEQAGHHLSDGITKLGHSMASQIAVGTVTGICAIAAIVMFILSTGKKKKKNDVKVETPDCQSEAKECKDKIDIKDLKPTAAHASNEMAKFDTNEDTIGSVSNNLGN